MIVTCTITDRMGWHKVPLLINHNYNNFKKQKNNWGNKWKLAMRKISPLGTLSEVKNSSIFEITQIFREEVVAIVIVISSVFGWI